MMNKNLSILIPTHNDVCLQLVQQLHAQASAIEALDFEIIVADDGSTQPSVVEWNRQIEQLSHTIYIIRCNNVGRSAIRNFLAQQAHYERLIFIDSDMTVIRNDFIRCYLQEPDSVIVYGGYEVPDAHHAAITADAQLHHNLRYRYELSAASAHTATARSRHPYRDFHTSNFLVNRNIFLNHPLDERFTHYGYEDVLWGKELKAQAIGIRHIDNPLGFCTFEDNAHFVAKTEEALRTLYRFSDDLEGYSSLLSLAHRLRRYRLAPLLLYFHRLTSSWERRLLCSSHPSLTIFKLYKLGYLLQLINEN